MTYIGVIILFYTGGNASIIHNIYQIMRNINLLTYRNSVKCQMAGGSALKPHDYLTDYVTCEHVDIFYTLPFHLASASTD